MRMHAHWASVHRLRWLLGSGRTAVLALSTYQNLCFVLVRHTANFLSEFFGAGLAGTGALEPAIHPVWKHSGLCQQGLLG